LIDLAAALNRASAKARGACRLAIVAESVDELRRRLGSAGQALRTDAAFPDSGPVAYGAAPLDGDIAFLFPGQGSQYLNMLAELALYSPVVREVFEQADGVLAGVLSSPLSTVIFPPPAYAPAEEAEYRRVLDQTWLAQPALGAAGFALYSLLRSVGIAPHVVAGHSYGEYVALCAGGCLTFPDLIRISEARGRVVQETQGRNLIAMVAVREKAGGLAARLAESPGVSIAGRNAPTQTILGGPRMAIEALLPRLDAAGISYQVLPMSAGFHIPEARPAAERFAEVLKDVRFEAPRIPI
jgi:acyl transferase domain-containing protein